MKSVPFSLPFEVKRLFTQKNESGQNETDETETENKAFEDRLAKKNENQSTKPHDSDGKDREEVKDC